MHIREHFLCMLAFIIVGSTLVFASDDTARTAPRDELQSWIGKNAVGVRSIDPVDEDFKDLEFLADVIGAAQVVQLGEASHAGGNGFQAKARARKIPASAHGIRRPCVGGRNIRHAIGSGRPERY